MSRFEIRQSRLRIATIAALCLVLTIGLFLRIYDLEMDPPLDVGRASQDLTTDPAHITSFAANHDRCGQSEPYPFPKWHVFKISLISGFSYLLAIVSNSDRIWSNLSGVIPSFLGLLLTILGILVDRDEKEKRLFAALIAAVFLCFNFTFVTFNRAPFLESGLILYSGLIFYLFQRYRIRLWNVVLMGALVALAGLTGKAFALSLGMALAAIIFTSNDEHRWKKLLYFAGAGAVAGVVIALILYGARLDSYLSYLKEQAFVSHGASWQMAEDYKRFLSQLLIFGTQSRMFIDSPFQSLAWYLALATAILYARHHYHRFQQNTLLRFALFWMLALALFLVPANYRPLRYATLLYQPMVLITVAVLFFEPKGEKKLPRPWMFISGILLGYLNWFFLYHLITDVLYNEQYKLVGWTVILITFFPALALTLVMIYRPAVWRWILRRTRWAAIFLLGMAVVTVVHQSYLYLRWAGDRAYSIRDASRDLGQILGPGAVLTGPYAPTLTLDNTFTNFIYAFGLQRPEFSIFNRFPITHVAVDVSNRDVAVADYPEMADAERLVEYYMRNRVVLILKVAGHTTNATALAYQPTDYERARLHLLGEKPDSALIYVDRFIQRYPANRSGLILRMNTFSQLSRPTDLLAAIDKAEASAPNDYVTLFLCARHLKTLAATMKREDLMKRAYATLERAVERCSQEDANTIIKDFENTGSGKLR